MTESSFLRQVQDLVARREVRISAHGYDELAADGLLARDVIAGISEAIVIEECPDYLGAMYSGASAGCGWRACSRGVGHPERSDIAGGAGHRVLARPPAVV